MEPMQVENGILSREDNAKVAIIAALVLVDAGWMVLAGYHFAFASLTKVGCLFLILLAVGEFYRLRRPNPLFVTMMRETAWLVAFAAAAAILSNLIATMDLPIIDEPLVTIDRFMGFHWHRYYFFFTSQPALGLLASILYVSALPLVVVAMVGSAFAGRPQRTKELVLALMIGAVIAIVISGFLPSAGALAWFRPDESQFGHHPIVNLAYKQTFYDLRAGNISQFSLDDVKGLIAFPSYHATICTLVMLAFRGVRKVFWPLVAFNIAVLATTPVEGGHHLIDAFAGVAVAVISLRIAEAWRYRLDLPRRTAAALVTVGGGKLPELAFPSAPASD